MVDSTGKSTPVSTKHIKGERPSAVQTGKNDKGKSPVSSPTILSPKNNEKTIRPTSPKDFNNKNLIASSVVPSSEIKPNLAVSAVNQG